MARNYSKMSKEQILRLAKNPGERSKIPTSLLPQQYRQMRAQNLANAQPVTPGSDMTVGQATQQRNALVEQKYGDALRSSQAQAAAIPQYYQNFRDQIAIANQARQAGYQAAVQAFQGLQQGTQAQQGQQQLADYQQQAAALGGQADPAAAQRAAQAAAIRGAAVGDLGSVLAAQGASQNAYGAAQYATAGQSQLEALQKELDNQRQLQLQKGAYSTQVDQDIRDQARKQVLENQAFGLDVQKAQVAAENAAADNARADAQMRQTASQRASQLNKYGFTTKEWNALSESDRQKWRSGAYTRRNSGGPSSTGGSKPASPATRNTANTQITRALNWAKQYKQANRKRGDAARVLVNGSSASSSIDERKYQELLKKGVKPVDARRRATVKSPSIPKFDQLYASVALDVAYDGHVSRRNAQKLHQMGLTLKDLGLPSYSSKQTPNRPTSINRRPHG